MRQFDCVNAFYNMVYFNENAYTHVVNSGYEELKQLREWFDEQQLIGQLMRFNMISEYATMLVNDNLDIDQISTLLHINLRDDLSKVHDMYAQKRHVIFLPGFNQEPWAPFTLEDPDIVFFQINEAFNDGDVFVDPFDGFVEALSHADEWPGAFIFNGHKRLFVPMREESDIIRLNELLKLSDEELFKKKKSDSTFYYHLSDVHLHSSSKQRALITLFDSMDHMVIYNRSRHRPKIIITGDLMDSPTEKNSRLAVEMINVLRKRYRAEVTFILGNHDVIMHGLNIARTQKSKIIAYLISERFHIFEDDKVLMIKFDSNRGGNFARGKIGKQQMKDVDAELESIPDLKDYCLMATLHHHVLPIQTADFIKTKWNEGRYIGRLEDASKALVDTVEFNQWLDKHQIKYVLHGHKHIPYFTKVDDRYLMAAGSATGSLQEQKSHYLSYNVVKFNNKLKRPTLCMIVYEDKKTNERQRIVVNLMA